jgi:hypothetical protein
VTLAYARVAKSAVVLAQPKVLFAVSDAIRYREIRRVEVAFPGRCAAVVALCLAIGEDLLAPRKTGTLGVEGCWISNVQGRLCTLRERQ